MRKLLFVFIAAVFMAMIFESCSTERAGYGKSGCGNYEGWNSHTKYRINGRN